MAFTYDGDLLAGIQYSGDLGASIGQQFNSDFVVDQLTYAGSSASYAYDDDLLLTQANGFTIDRNVQHGLPDAITNNHYQQQRSYNAYGEPSSVITQVANNAAYSYTLTYNDLSLIVGKSETLHDGSTHQYVYTYDDNRRLKNVMKDSVLTESYGYDHNGNRTAQTNTARGIASQVASYNIADQLTQDGNVTYQYDVDGYLTQKTDGNDITHYAYSRQGRLLSVQTPTDLIEYRHNAMGNRVAKSVNGQTTEKYLWLDKTTLLATYDANNNFKQRFEYTLGHAPTSFMQNGNRYYIATDHLGSPRAISDENGNIIKAMAYDSYGNVISDSNPEFSIPFGYAGGLQDSDTKLIRFGFRDYDSQTGRWTARDPIGLSGGLNVYGYVQNNPIGSNDRYGLETKGFSLNVSAGAGAGITVGVNAIVDSSGNVAFQIVGGAGGDTPGLSLMGNVEGTSAGTVYDLEGVGAQTGIDGTLGAAVEGGLIFGPGYTGAYAGAGGSVGIPVGFSGYVTYTHNLLVLKMPKEMAEIILMILGLYSDEGGC